VRYSDAVAAAPPGSASFRAEDIRRLQPATLHQLLKPTPANPPLDDYAVALGPAPELLAELDEERRGELRRQAARTVSETERRQVRNRLVRGLFWFLVYELAPQRWDALARSEPIHPQLAAALPASGARVLDVGAGSGRLAVDLAERAKRLVALEPSPPLRRLLARRLGGRGWAVAAFADHIPMQDAWADLVTCCATITPDEPVGGEKVLAELERCCRPGGTVALVSPEDPAWFEARGYERRDFGEVSMPRCDPELERFFGRRSPPHELLLKQA
jgi:SAM-dependent methyltransferase